MLKSPNNLRSFESLVEVVRALRHPTEGCPWDLEQTNKSLTPHMIEEAFECVEAIESGNRDFVIEELGDVLLQPILHSVIAEQDKNFDLFDVIEALNKKLVYRHSHVFSDVVATDAHSAIANWEAMKAKEKEGRPKKDGFEIPVALPALQRSQKIGAKTRKYNFDWENAEQVFQKVREELQEVKEELDWIQKTADPEENANELKEDLKADMEMEIGDLLFTVAQLARHADIDAEGALRKANQKFESRFFKMKKLAESRSRNLKEMPPADLEKLWEEIKSDE